MEDFYAQAYDKGSSLLACDGMLVGEQGFKGSYCLQLEGQAAKVFLYCLAVKMKALQLVEMQVIIYQQMQRHTNTSMRTSHPTYFEFQISLLPYIK
jgi:hypothetical protein